MLKNYKKLVSLISAAAMLASLAAPTAMADTADEIISASEMAELQAAVTLVEDNFDDLEEKVLITLGKDKQDPYTELNVADIYIGNSQRGGAEDTGAWIKDGVGVDGTKALVLSSGAKATGTYSPRLEFKVPETRDNFMISMDVYPTSKQDMTYSDDPAKESAAGTEFGLTTDEWNKVDIYVTRSGRVINVNDTLTVLSDEGMTAPVIWGTGEDNAGEMYIDNIKINALTTLPTPIPTPSPLPPHQPVIGDVYDFEEYTAGTVVFLNNVATPTYTALDGFELNVASRGNGAAANTRIAIASGSGVDNSKALQLNYDTFADTNRGPRITLVEPLEEEYKITFQARADETQAIVVAEDSSTNAGTTMTPSTTGWSTVEIFMFAGQRLILCDGAFVQLSATKNLPTLWGRNANGSGSFYMDNYTITEVSAQEVTDAMAMTIDITNSDNTVYLDDSGVYNFIEGFPVASETCGASTKWEAFESTDEGATWVSTSDLKVGKTAISTAGVSTEKLYKIIATVDNDGLTASKEFVLKYVESDDVVDVVLANLDITSELYAKEVEKKEVTAEDGTVSAKYIIRGNFAVPTADWVATIDWSSSDESLVKVGPKGSMLVYPKEETTVTLTASATYNGETKTKDFTLDLANYYITTVDVVETELATVTYSPNGTNGDKIASITLNGDGATTVSYDLALTTTSKTKGVKIEYESSDKNILTADGVINADNMDENEVTLTKKVSYSINDVKVYSAEKDYEINVQFVPEDVKPVAVEAAKAYALAADASATEESIEDSTYYNIAMEMLYDRYVARFDANYDENFEDIPTSIDSDFDLPTEGAFGSKITWTSTATNIKIDDEGHADVTRPTTDKKAKLIATFTSGAAVNEEAKTIDVTVEGKSSGKGSSSGGSSGGGGSSYGGGNAYIGSIGSTSATPKPSTATPVQDTTVKGEFTDLGDVSWAAVAINYLADKGIVSGRTSTTFAPNDNITRAEFAKIITGVFDLPTGGISAGFADVADDAWYAPYVNTCFAAGIITGYDSTTFGPDDLVTRQDMAVMVMRAANLKGIAVEAINAKIDFADADQIGAYAVDAVTTLQQGGIINGMTADTFAPTANATRAQAAKILYSFCN